MAVLDEAGDLVGLVGDDGLGEEGRERQVGEGELGGDPALLGFGGQPGELVAAAERRGLGQEVGEPADVGRGRRAATALNTAPSPAAEGAGVVAHGQRPEKTGCRFSMKARRPSL
ncbi:MAG: hypothetical protein NVS2B11_13770 [Acetobacteraceae bacterium]